VVAELAIAAAGIAALGSAAALMPVSGVAAVA